MKAHSIGREAVGSPKVEPAQEAGRHWIRYWNQVLFLGQSGLRIRLGGKGPVAIDPFRTWA
jgi:hypothetical protein